MMGMNVFLPDAQSTVTLPPYMARTLLPIIHSGSSGISSLQLTREGCLSPSNTISKLRSLGAIIRSTRKDAIDFNGATRHGVAHYQYMGWYPDQLAILNREQEAAE